MPIPAAGVTPISYFLSTANVPPGAVVAMMADPIDVTTGDYLSIERGFDPTDAAVLTACRTVRDSGSAVQGIGQQFADHPRVDDKLETYEREEVRLTLKALVDAGEVAVDKVTIAPYGDAAELYIQWQNIARQNAQSVRLPPSLLVGTAV